MKASEARSLTKPEAKRKEETQKDIANHRMMRLVRALKFLIPRAAKNGEYGVGLTVHRNRPEWSWEYQTFQAARDHFRTLGYDAEINFDYVVANKRRVASMRLYLNWKNADTADYKPSTLESLTERWQRFLSRL